MSSVKVCLDAVSLLVVMYSNNMLRFRQCDKLWVFPGFCLTTLSRFSNIHMACYTMHCISYLHNNRYMTYTASYTLLDIKVAIPRCIPYQYNTISRAHVFVIYSLCGRTFYRTISWVLQGARFVFKLLQSLWNLTGTSAAVLPRCLSNLRATLSSRLHEILR